MTIARNEEDWVRASILSVLDFVDEVIAADHNSDDDTAGILKSLAERYPQKIRFLTIRDDDFVNAVNQVMAATCYRWILRWHADFIARTSGSCGVSRLVDRVRQMSPYQHSCIGLAGVALDGDLEHQLPRQDAPEPFLFTFSPWTRYYARGRWEALHVPWFYRKEDWPTAYYFHMRSVKSGPRLLQGLYWSQWFEARSRGSEAKLGDFIAERATKDFGASTVEEAARKYVLDEFRGAKPYRQDVSGEYPEVLRPWLEHPPYRLVYADGRLVDRIEPSKGSADAHLVG